MSNANELSFPFRDMVQKAGLLTAVRNTRAAVRREMTNWVRAGCPSPAPNVVKFHVVRSHVERYRTPIFVETGTYLGSMVEYIAATTGAKCHTIEIDEATYHRAQKILSGRKIELLLGDSGKVLPELLKRIDRPATFWLDGHYSGSFTGRAEIDTPVSAELDAILEHPIKNHVILIDDARDFTGEDGYPRLCEVLAHFDRHPDYKASVSADIIRIEPRGS